MWEAGWVRAVGGGGGGGCTCIKLGMPAMAVHSFYTRWYDCITSGGNFKAIYFVLPKNIRNLYR